MSNFEKIKKLIENEFGKLNPKIKLNPNTIYKKDDSLIITGLPVIFVVDPDDEEQDYLILAPEGTTAESEKPEFFKKDDYDNEYENLSELIQEFFKVNQ